MRDLIVTENITLDGVIDATDGWFVPSGDDEDAEQLEVERRHRDSADAVLLGRLTFEQFGGYWPKQTEDTTGVTDYLNRTRKYVVSRTLTDPAWENSSVVRLEDIAALEQQPGKAIVATGSVQLVQHLVGTGLIDEYRLFVHPVVLGHGRRLFEQAVSGLRLAEATPFRSGVVLLTYRTG